MGTRQINQAIGDRDRDRIPEPLARSQNHGLAFRGTGAEGSDAHRKELECEPWVIRVRLCRYVGPVMATALAKVFGH